MSYSRWCGIGSGHWYTYWSCHPNGDSAENRDDSLFHVCGVKMFTAAELRSDMDACMAAVREIDSEGDVDELRTYANEFLADIDNDYPDAMIAERDKDGK